MLPNSFLLALLLAVISILFSDAFTSDLHSKILLPRSCNIHTVFYAKNTNKNKKRLGGPRGAGRRGKPKRDGLTPDEDKSDDRPVTIPEPTALRKQIISLERPPSNNGTDLEPNSAISVCMVEVDDKEWWENPENNNPYGGKLWPSSLAIAEYLTTMGNLNGYDVLELGCGNGLVSIVAAATGARVVASDISPTAMKLTKIGWLETQKRRMQIERNVQEKNEEKKDDKVATAGSLNTFILDLFSKRPLPLSASSPNTKIVVATAMMYEAGLAKILAHRAFEACSRGAWVIIGDDDTGEREGGRDLFLSEFQKLEKSKGVSFKKEQIRSTVKSKTMNWSSKQVILVHLNSPFE